MEILFIIGVIVKNLLTASYSDFILLKMSVLAFKRWPHTTY